MEHFAGAFSPLEVEGAYIENARGWDGTYGAPFAVDWDGDRASAKFMTSVQQFQDFSDWSETYEIRSKYAQINLVRSDAIETSRFRDK